MKALKLFTKPLLLLVITGVMFGSCSKEAGPKGDTGIQGEQGKQGIAGPDGSTILNGTVEPANSLGKNGDFYINTATSVIYGPKTAAGWGAGKSILGAKGTAGSKILSGTVTPAATVGAVGDYYLDKTSYSLYGPKLSTGWGTAISLKGTANVIYSGWNYAVNFRDTTADNSAVKAADLLAPTLSTDILNKGTVQVYFDFGGGVYALPYTSNAGGKLNTMAYWPRLKHFIITRFTADNSNSVALSSILQYRYVIIPGGTAVSVAKKVDINNYEAVKRAYNIPD
ncbi:hypothetical protein [Mucilaginibacter rigui]|nr:hypothetical protein [Mucilaginibacter rigui]